MSQIKVTPYLTDDWSKVADRMWRLPVKPKKVYVAASMGNQIGALRFSISLMDAGFIVTSRWLRSDFVGKPPNDEEHWSEYAKYEEKWGERDVQDMEAADTLVILATMPSSAGGYHVELGYFLGRGSENIIVVGSRPNVFYYRKDVRWTADSDKLVQWLQHPSHGEPYKRHGDTVTLTKPPIKCQSPDPAPDSTLFAPFEWPHDDGQHPRARMAHDQGASMLSGYDNFVNGMWSYDPTLHGNMPEVGYTALALAEESGEVAGKVKKIYREAGGEVRDATPIIKEMGDALYYLTKLSHLFGTDLAGVAAANREKLMDRLARGKLHGEGDDR